MEAIVRDWGGAERSFALDFGRVLELEEACDRLGIGAIFLALGRHSYTAKQVYNTIRLGLVGGGMRPEEARRLMAHWESTPLERSAQLAIDILLGLMAGVEPAEVPKPVAPEQPFKAGEILAAFLQLGLSPEQVRRMSYADFVALSRALGRDPAAPPSEEELDDMVSRLAKG